MAPRYLDALADDDDAPAVAFELGDMVVVRIRLLVVLEMYRLAHRCTDAEPIAREGIPIAAGAHNKGIVDGEVGDLRQVHSAVRRQRRIEVKCCSGSGVTWFVFWSVGTLWLEEAHLLLRLLCIETRSGRVEPTADARLLGDELKGRKSRRRRWYGQRRESASERGVGGRQRRLAGQYPQRDPVQLATKELHVP